jgi:hypothetical protein
VLLHSLIDASSVLQQVLRTELLDCGGCARRYPDSAHPDFTTWPNEAFHQVRNSAAYQKLEVEWAEQREWMHPLPSWSSLFGWSRSAKSAAVATGAGRAPTAREATQWNAFVRDLEDRLAPLIRPERPEPEAAEMTRMESAAPPQKCGEFEVPF